LKECTYFVKWILFSWEILIHSMILFLLWCNCFGDMCHNLNLRLKSKAKVGQKGYWTWIEYAWWSNDNKNFHNTNMFWKEMLQKFETQNVILLKVPFWNSRKIYNFDVGLIESYKIDNKEKCGALPKSSSWWIQCESIISV
jgi:hypothetical protein